MLFGGSWIGGLQACTRRRPLSSFVGIAGASLPLAGNLDAVVALEGGRGFNGSNEALKKRQWIVALP
ncbi:hypothetical protein CMZ82_15160 [Lysobacteraceae bacterium NML93-0792]|nr:hypothetical protein CMZ82_15160 [Xanthomonadaceae bacterium NML93-0792]PBS14857.1 hypothetical protein CMZ81_13625 [Xanthomonadaceae bacterium NML93-0793]PBS17779.1 hypothetical protein CMZ80_15205 [Xanthomonadaceae bacterium NML93-0831]